MHESTALEHRRSPTTTSDHQPRHTCPSSKRQRDRIRALASDLVGSWRVAGVPAPVRSAAGLREQAEEIVRRAGGSAEHAGWTMVTIVSEYWRERLASGGSGRRLILLPDCQVAPAKPNRDESVPHVCGPGCGIATIWAAARDSGWTVEPTSRAVAAIGSLLTGQYDGILGVARLSDLEKAFGMLPAFTLPVAAVPYQPLGPAEVSHRSCAEATAGAALDPEWVLGLLGIAGGGPAPVGESLPLLREAAELFRPAALEDLATRLGLGDGFGAEPGTFDAARVPPLDAAAAMGGEFLTRGGKFLRPFVSLAAYDAVRADAAARHAAVRHPAGPREAARATAVAIEIFHKASLVHDDIEDEDRMRYGRPTMHVEQGVPAAVNTGDYLLGLGYRIIAGLPGVDAAATRDLIAVLSDAHVRLARGQGAELWWRRRAELSGDVARLTPDEALAIYGLKTSPAFEAAVALGARLAGLPAERGGPIERFALHVGTGFQVLNDLKDWDGDLENDRQAAGDLLGGRPTLMWALALERLPHDDVARLRTIAREAAAEGTFARAIVEARLLYDRADVFRRAAAIAADQRIRATAAIAGCPLPRLRDVLEFLLDLAVPEAAASHHVQ